MMVKFLPTLLSLMVENSLRSLHKQLKEDHTPFSLPAAFINFISRHSGAMHITCSYALHLLEKKDIRSFSLLLPAVAKAFIKSESVLLPDSFLHFLILHMDTHREVLKESTFLLILRDFWVPCCHSSEQILLHLFRMLWFLHGKISEDLLREVLETVEPGKEVGLACDNMPCSVATPPHSRPLWEASPHLTRTF